MNQNSTNYILKSTLMTMHISAPGMKLVETDLDSITQRRIDTCKCYLTGIGTMHESTDTNGMTYNQNIITTKMHSMDSFCMPK